MKRAIKDSALYAEWTRLHDYCQACGAGSVPLSTHHIIQRGRSDEPCNLLRLCLRCHNLAEGLLVIESGQHLLPLTLGVCLTLKRIREPDDYKPERLEFLRGSPLPKEESIPFHIWYEWRQRRG